MSYSNSGSSNFLLKPKIIFILESILLLLKIGSISNSLFTPSNYFTSYSLGDPYCISSLKIMWLEPISNLNKINYLERFLSERENATVTFPLSIQLRDSNR